MINIGDSYTTKAADTANHPWGQLIDESAPAAGDGSEAIAALPNDVYNALTAWVSMMGFPLSGTTDNVTDSDFADANAHNFWSQHINYRPGALVFHSGVHYVCIANSINHTPPNAAYWQTFQARIFDLNNPVGSVRMFSNSFDPNTLVGTWVALTGFPVGYDAADTDFNAHKKTGGGKTHTHNVGFTGWGSLQSAGGHLPEPTTDGRLVTGAGKSESGENLESLGHAETAQTLPATGHLPPYVTLAIWERTA